MTEKSRPSVRDAWRDLVTAAKAPTTAQPDAAPAPADEQPESPAVVAPVKRKWTALPSAQFVGDDGTLQLYPDGVDYMAGFKKSTIPLASIQSVSLEEGADLESRITATRLVLVGVFALAIKKKKGGEKYLTIESDDAFVVVKVPRKNIDKAHKFSAAVRTAMKRATR